MPQALPPANRRRSRRGGLSPTASRSADPRPCRLECRGLGGAVSTGVVRRVDERNPNHRLVRRRGVGDGPNRRRVGCQHEVGQQRQHHDLRSGRYWPHRVYSRMPIPTVKIVRPISPGQSARESASLIPQSLHDNKCRLSLRESSATFAERKATMSATYSLARPYCFGRTVMPRS